LYSSCCQPAGGDDLPCQGMSNAITRKFSVTRGSFMTPRYCRPSEAGGMQAEQGNALTCVLDVEAMRHSPAARDAGSAGNRLEARLHEAALCGARRETVLEIAQMRHEDLDVALDLQVPEFRQCDQVVKPGFGIRLPEFRPGFARRAQRQTNAGRSAPPVAQSRQCVPSRRSRGSCRYQPAAGNVVSRYCPRRTSAASAFTFSAAARSFRSGRCLPRRRQRKASVAIGGDVIARLAGTPARRRYRA